MIGKSWRIVSLSASLLVNEKPTVEFLSSIKQAGFPLPEFVETNKSAALATRKLGRLRPWAWGADSVELFAPLFANLNAEKRTAEKSFNPNIAQLYSKAWSAELLRKVLNGSRAALPRIGVQLYLIEFKALLEIELFVGG